MAIVHDHPRPDPQLGVFETLLVIDGRPVEPEAHFSRLASSLETLFPSQPPPPLDVPSLMHPYGHLSDGTSPGALRITVAPDRHDRLVSRVEIREAHLGGEVSLQSFPLVGGLGAHKWADRSLLDAAQAQLPDDTLPLIVDTNGAALEASRANVFAVRDGALFTPPLDGRILPGVTRARVLEIAATDGLETHEAELSHDDLLAAEGVFLTGSIRGIEPVRELDGVSVAQDGEVAARLAAELRRAWLGAPVG